MRLHMIIILMLFVVLINPIDASAAMNPAPYFCERQGYNYTLDHGAGDYYCYFDESHACRARNFFKGICGEEYVKELPCVPEGEPVFSQLGEECCEGLESNFGWWYSAIGQPHCIKEMNIFQKLKVFFFGY